MVALELAEDGVVLRTDRDSSFYASVAVIAAGAWTSDLVQPLGIALPVKVTRETVAFFEVAGASAVPVVIDFASAGNGNGQGLYALPSPGSGLKVAAHHSGRVCHPNNEGEADAQLVSRMSRWVRKVFHASSGTATRTETCLYTTAPEENFLFVSCGRLVVASACSGHGFKFAPATAKRVAQLAHDAGSRHIESSKGAR